MVTSPQLVQRTAQPYMAIRRQVSMDGFGPVIDESFPQVFAWLREHALGPAGPPLIRYLFINMPTKLDVEIGVPVRAQQALVWDKRETDNGEEWGARFESYLTDPSAEPDQEKWQTEIYMRLAD